MNPKAIIFDRPLTYEDYYRSKTPLTIDDRRNEQRNRMAKAVRSMYYDLNAKIALCTIRSKYAHCSSVK